jgi:hypothetical protein
MTTRHLGEKRVPNNPNVRSWLVLCIPLLRVLIVRLTTSMKFT